MFSPLVCCFLADHKHTHSLYYFISLAYLGAYYITKAITMISNKRNASNLHLSQVKSHTKHPLGSHYLTTPKQREEGEKILGFCKIYSLLEVYFGQGIKKLDILKHNWVIQRFISVFQPQFILYHQSKHTLFSIICTLNIYMS